MMGLTMDSSNIHSFVQQIYAQGIKPCINVDDTGAYLLDPVFHIKRNRVIAETLNAVLRVDLESDNRLIQQLFDYLISTQHTDGSWSEIHAHYDQPSALITAIVAEAFLTAIEKKEDSDLFRSVVENAKDFVLSQEKKSGYYLKSTNYTADHLNVDASCGAFLAHYARVFDDEEALNASKRASDHIINFQKPDGVYPYAVTKGTYSYVKQVPCVHYQGVTLYYLSKIHTVTDDHRLKDSLILGGNWLIDRQQENGFFDWSQSGLLFTYYVSGAYAFALASFSYLSQFDSRFEKNTKVFLSILRSHQPSLFVRWEQAKWLNLSLSVFDSIRTAKLTEVSFKQCLFRFLYAMYRQIARRRYSETIDDTLFNTIVSLLRLKVSTIESFANYPDLFMTSEIIDCLSSIQD